MIHAVAMGGLLIWVLVNLCLVSLVLISAPHILVTKSTGTNIVSAFNRTLLRLVLYIFFGVVILAAVGFYKKVKRFLKKLL